MITRALMLTRAPMPRLFAALPVVAALLLTSGCGPATELSDGPIDGLGLDDRSAYNELDSPAGTDLVTADPTQLALELFGASEPVEGNFSESVDTVVESEPREW
jgi:hypothetical protein